jgi:small multidrug resistance family-3 protein
MLSLPWDWGMDGYPPDRWDYLGGALCVFGMALIMYGPRAD